MNGLLTKRSIRAAAAWALACGSILLSQAQPIFALTTPTLTTLASTPALVGGTMTDTATLAGGTSPTGTITFQLNTGCGSAVIFTSTRTVAGSGTYTSDPFGPLVAGAYFWVASYSGDLNNNPVATVCGDGAESVVVPEYCPPHSCPAPTTPCGTVGPGNTITTTVSTTTCSGSTPRLTVTTAFLVGPVTVCYGPEKSLSCTVPAGGVDFNTNTETVFANTVAVPTLSIWGLAALVVGLGAFALRRLKLPAS